MGWGVHKIDLNELAKSYEQGMTYFKMAEKFNCTNGGISFQVRKLKASGIIKSSRVEKNNPKKSIKIRPFKKSIMDTSLTWKPLHKIKDMPWNYISETGKTIMDLKHDDCRWPCNDGLYCGKISVTGQSYCENHQKISVGKNGTS